MREIINRLRNIKPNERISEIKKQIKTEQNPRKIDALVKELKILENLKKGGLSPLEAFTQTTLPVMPAQFRAPVETGNGGVQVPDINILLRNIGIANDTLKKARKVLPEEQLKKYEKNLYLAVEDLSGFTDPKVKEVDKNAIGLITGSQPKKGFFQRKVVRKRQDLSARTVISPNPEIGVDEATVPYEIGAKLYEPFIKKELFQRGFKSAEIKKEMENLSPLIKDTIRQVGKERPVVINRSPSIWHGSVTAHNPIFTEDKVVGVPVSFDAFQKADHDGDSTLAHIDLRHFWNKNNTQTIKVLGKIFIFLHHVIRIIKKGDDYGIVSRNKQRTDSQVV